MALVRCARVWTCVLDLGLTLWVLRAIVVALLFGFAILGLAPQAQDLLVDVAAGPWWYTILFLLAVFFVWAMPTHYAARLLVETDARYLLRVRRRKSGFLDGLKKWGPRVLGLLPFVAMLIGVARSWSNVPAVDVSGIAALAELSDITAWTKVSLLLLGGYLALSAVLFWWYVALRKGLSDHPWIETFNAALSRPVAWVAARLPRALALGRHAPGLASPTSSLGPVYLILMFIACACLPLLAPVLFAESFPRAIAVPFVLAGWTPLAAYASGVGRYLQVPIISIALIGNALLTYALGDNYWVRLVDAVQHVDEVVKAQSGKSNDYALVGYEPPITERLKLHDAVRLWKRANTCESNSSTCPRPIIVAASGGASRAGFFTASVIGKLIDGGGEIPPGDARKRLFAISSVSGSSVGAVMSVAALAASAGPQPCRAQDFWLLYNSKVTDWRSCLEALMSGDSLTPVFAGMVFRDTLRFLGGQGGAGSIVKWSDRASLIEQSWERHFHRSIKDQATPSPRCLNNLDCPFLTLRPREVEGEVAWLPLLMLNGTSVSTGQRIVTSTIDPWYRANDCPRTLDGGDPEKCPVLDHAYDFHWLISDRTHLAKDEKPSELTDVRLSTAAHNSARFPLISPPGEVRAQANNVADRIVDGGFFENFGAQTALELAGAIRAVDDKLVPFILIISNDPEIPTDDVLKAPDDAEGAFLTDLSAPAKTILNTRAARGTLALDAVVTVLSDDLNERCAPYAAHLRVWPEYEGVPANAAGRKPGGGKVRPLSFSWWLSKPVQLRLHLQTEFSDANSADNKAALRAVSAALGPKPAGCAGKRLLPVQRKYEGVRPLLQRQRP